MTLYGTRVIAPEGDVFIQDRRFVALDGKSMDIPLDIWSRATRLELRFGRERYSYMAAWCAKNLEQTQ